MSAIITENFRRNNTRLFLNDISAQSTQTNGKYYLGIGKQDPWSSTEENINFSIPVAVGTRADELEVLNNLSTLVSLNALTGIGRVIPAVPWKSDNTGVYQAYSSYDSSRFYPSGALQPCYVTINGAIFLCLKTGLNASGVAKPSTVQPTVQSSKYAPFTTADAGAGSGYIWALVQETPNTQVIRNNTFTDIRTTKLLDPELSASTTQCGGLVTGFTVVNGGTGYVAPGGTNPSVLKLKVNDGFTATDRSATEITLNFTLGIGVDNATTITSVSFPAGWPTYVVNGTATNAALNALFASIEFSGSGSGATIVPTIAPPKGFAYDPSAVMTSWFAGLSIGLDDSISGDNFYSRYRQISIVKNPTVESGQASAETLNALKYITLSDDQTVSLAPEVNSSVLRNAANQTVGYADYYDAVTKRLYFHQNLSSGYRELPPTGSITIGYESGTFSEIYNYTSINNGEFINDGNAEVLFTENRSFISRASGQTEDLILIIQF